MTTTVDVKALVLELRQAARLPGTMIGVLTYEMVCAAEMPVILDALEEEWRRSAACPSCATLERGTAIIRKLTEERKKILHICMLRTIRPATALLRIHRLLNDGTRDGGT